MFSYLLSTNDNKKLKDWITKKDKPLFITGYDGSGKTYWANDLLKSYHIININSEHIKFNKDITDYLHLSLLKKDIFMMISPDKIYKALLVDDIQLFIQNDKPSLTKIHKFTQSLNYKNNPTIFICNDLEDKCCKAIKSQSYVIEVKFNRQHYKHILKSKFTENSINEFLRKTQNLNTILATAGNFNSVQNDKVTTVDVTLDNILTKEHSINDLIRSCSSDYSIISLNMLENIPSLIKLKSSVLYEIYKSVIVNDSMEYKYIQNNIDADVSVFYSCVIPTIHIKRNINNMVKLKYNRYISRSIIQIHNQNILQDNTVLYLNILKTMYKSITTEVDKIDLESINMKTLEKQMKVFNYYYNKNMNKKQFTKIIKSIS